MPEGAAGGEHMIRVENLVKRFGDVEVLRGISFDVTRGETLCILGGSGGGKSTLLKCMIGVHDSTGGSVVIDGHDIVGMNERSLDEVRRKFGVMFQGGALLDSMTIADNVALPIERHTKLDADTIDTMVKMKLMLVDLLHAAVRRPSAISGGMQKRAAVARALALDTKILFYDEPSAGLDPISTTRIDQLINKLKTTFKMTNIVVTHVMESVQRIADHIIMLDQGKVILDGTLDDLMNSDDPRIKQFRTGELTGPGGGATSTAEYHRDLLM